MYFFKNTITIFKNLFESLERIFLSHDEVTNWEYFTNSSVCLPASLRTTMAPLTAIVFKMEKKCNACINSDVKNELTDILFFAVIMHFQYMCLLNVAI